jgi:hypothetical protein
MLDFGISKRTPATPRVLSELSLDLAHINGANRQLPVYTSMSEALRIMGQLRKEISDVSKKLKPLRLKGVLRSVVGQGGKLAESLKPAPPQTTADFRRSEACNGPPAADKVSGKVLRFTPPTAPSAMRRAPLSGTVRSKPQSRNSGKPVGHPNPRQMVTFIVTHQHWVQSLRPGQAQAMEFYRFMPLPELLQVYREMVPQVLARKRWRRHENAFLNVTAGSVTPRIFAPSPVSPRKVSPLLN